jgi:UDP-N-acetylglucosamine 4-epimerase
MSTDGYNYLVTGGAGFIGSHLVEHLLNNGASKVRVLDNFTTGDPSNLDFENHANLEVIRGDIRNLAVCMEACKNCDFVLHEAAIGSVQRSFHDPKSTYEINVLGFLNILEAARKCHVQRLVYASSSSVYGTDTHTPKQEDYVGQPLSPYAFSKQQNENAANFYATNFGMEIIGLRYFNVFGPRQKKEGSYAAVIPVFIDAMLSKKKAIVYGDGLQIRDYTFIDNVVQANMRALFTKKKEALNKTFNIACGKPNNLFQLIEQLQEAWCEEITYTKQPSRPGESQYSVADISRARSLLQYSPCIEVHEGLKLMMASMLSYDFTQVDDRT